MGEMAEDILDGSCCALCGCYFRAEPREELKTAENPDGDSIYSHDYPVACEDCWEEDCGYQKAQVGTF